MAKKLPSPCVDVCKFRRGGHCIGCSMTKGQKKMYKALRRPEHQHIFVGMLMHQQAQLGKYSHWLPAWLKKCRKKNVRPPEAAQQKLPV